MITEKDTAIAHIKKVMYMMDKLTGNGYRSAESVFVDFLTLSACSYSNVFDRTNKEAREKQYLDIVKKIQKRRIKLFFYSFRRTYDGRRNLLSTRVYKRHFRVYILPGKIIKKLWGNTLHQTI